MARTALLNWLVLLGFFGGLLAWIAWRRWRRGRPATAESFFGGRDEGGREVGPVTLTATLLVSWIFAKSVQNAADLGQAYGLVGGIAYAAYWLSFLVAGVAIDALRRAGYASLHHFLRHRFGVAAVWLFSLIVLVRLWNEIWSNTMVVAQFFGSPEDGGAAYLAAAWIVTGLVLAYTLLGGFRSSILTDVVQMALAAVVLLLILGLILPRAEPARLAASGTWSLAGGADLLLVALIQGFSYPFHDPVMTDRGFLTNRRTMRRGFAAAGLLGFVFIALFSLVGVFNRAQEIGGHSTIATAAALGLPAIVLVNAMMLTSAGSTLDSTFSSTGKLLAVDLLPGRGPGRLRVARIAMAGLAVLGGAMVHVSPAILKATTVSGTMVVGLTPVFVLARWRRPGAASYLASVLLGAGCGIAYAAGWRPAAIGTGPYGGLLWWNAAGVAACFAVYALAAWLAPARRSADSAGVS